MSDTKGSGPEYDRVYRSGDYDVASVYDHIIRIRQRYLDDSDGPVLDHGFGNGVISAYFAREGFDVHGVETSRGAWELIRDRADQLGLDPAAFHVLDSPGVELPFADETFGAAVSNQVLYFLPERDLIDKAVAEIRRVLRPGGKVAATVMAEDNYYFTKFGQDPVPDEGPVDVRVRGRISRDFRLYRFRDADDLRSCFENAGFVVDDLGWFDFKLLDVERAKHYIVLAHRES